MYDANHIGTPPWLLVQMCREARPLANKILKARTVPTELLEGLWRTVQWRGLTLTSSTQTVQYDLF